MNSNFDDTEINSYHIQSEANWWTVSLPKLRCFTDTEINPHRIQRDVNWWTVYDQKLHVSVTPKLTHIVFKTPLTDERFLTRNFDVHWHRNSHPITLTGEQFLTRNVHGSLTPKLTRIVLKATLTDEQFVTRSFDVLLIPTLTHIVFKTTLTAERACCSVLTIYTEMSVFHTKTLMSVAWLRKGPR